MFSNLKNSKSRPPGTMNCSSEFMRCPLNLGDWELLTGDPLFIAVLTPHVSLSGAENIRERRFQVLLENARRFAAGEPLHNVVDKAAWY